MKTRLTATLLALVATASAQIDSGGGKSAIGTVTNHASIGGIIGSAPQLQKLGHPRLGLLAPAPGPDRQRHRAKLDL
jgi:hypothetical protein